MSIVFKVLWKENLCCSQICQILILSVCSDLRNNIIKEVEDGALQGAEALQDLLLSNNQLRQVKPKMFAGLRNLTTLYVVTAL